MLFLRETNGVFNEGGEGGIVVVGGEENDGERGKKVVERREGRLLVRGSGGLTIGGRRRCCYSWRCVGVRMGGRGGGCFFLLFLMLLEGA